jgi:hypothetical protein
VHDGVDPHRACPAGSRVQPDSIRRPSGRWDSASGYGHNVHDFRSSTSAAPPNQATTLESHLIQMIQELTGQALRGLG